MHFQYKLLAVSVVALVATSLGANAVAAPVGWPVEITAHTVLEGASEFESSLEDCSTGTVVNGNSIVSFTPWGGVFNGDKEFTCDGGESGFTIRLKARFGEGGSTGTWTFVGGWGDFEGIKGSGSLVGLITGAGIDDIYTGTFR